MNTRERQRIGRYRLHTLAADALRHTTTHPDGRAVVDCPCCAIEIRTRQPGRATEIGREGSPLHGALLDHLFHDCPAVEVAR